MSELRRLSVLAVVAWVAFGGPLAASEGQNKSNYGHVASLVSTIGVAFQNLDTAAIVERCRDHDGCVVTLNMDGPLGLTVASQRVFLSAYSQQFRTTLNATGHLDNNITVDDLVSVFAGGDAGCEVSDADDFSSFADVSVGFSLFFFVNTVNTAWTCAVHFED